MAAARFSCSALAADRKGTAVLELGLALPVLMVMIVGLIDVARCSSSQMSLQQASARALERVQVARTEMTSAAVKTEAATAAGVPESQVTIDTWLECNSVRQAAAVTVCVFGQTRARYTQVAITSSYTPYFPYSPVGTRQADGSVALSASTSVRTQ